MLNEDGMVEVDKGLFSIEPMIRMGDSLFNWSNMTSVQSLDPLDEKSDFTFLPSVTWQCKDLKFITSVVSTGKPNESSDLNIRYTFENLSDKPEDLAFYLLIRPFQANPYR